MLNGNWGNQEEYEGIMELNKNISTRYTNEWEKMKAALKRMWKVYNIIVYIKKRGNPNK